MRSLSINNEANSFFSIKGGVFIALALIVIVGVIIGPTMNELKSGLGDFALWFAGIAFVVLVMVAIAILVSRFT